MPFNSLAFYVYECIFLLKSTLLLILYFVEIKRKPLRCFLFGHQCTSLQNDYLCKQK